MQTYLICREQITTVCVQWQHVAWEKCRAGHCFWVIGTQLPSTGAYHDPHDSGEASISLKEGSSDFPKY